MTARILLPTLLVALVAGCPSNTTEEGVPQEDPNACATEDAAAVVDVTGVFDYRGDRAPFFLRGTITFEQTGDTVKVLDTTYANAPQDRRLEGEAMLVGNRLDITLLPINGDTDYEADLVFLFGDGGDSFCCSFSDTNNDIGDMGSYRGTKK